MVTGKDAPATRQGHLQRKPRNKVTVSQNLYIIYRERKGVREVTKEKISALIFKYLRESFLEMCAFPLTNDRQRFQ